MALQGSCEGWQQQAPSESPCPTGSQPPQPTMHTAACIPAYGTRLAPQLPLCDQ